MIKSPQKRFRRSLFLLFAVLTLLVGAWGALEWDVRRMENAVWDRGDFSGLEKREPLLKWVAEHRLTPEHLKGRVSGLLGDLLHNESKSKAYEFYQKSMEPFDAFFNQGQIDPKLMVDQFRLADSDFAKGATDQQTATFKAPPLGDEDMEQPPSRFEGAGENCRDALLKIQKLDGADREMGMNLFRSADTAPEWDEMRNFCEKHRETINALNELGVRFVASDDGDIEIFGNLSHFIRLVAIDAFLQGHNGNDEAAKRSLNCTYRLMGYLEQRPELMTALVENSLRESILDFLNSKNGESIRNYFEHRHVMIEDPHFWCITGTYHSSQKLISDALAGQSSTEQKLRYLVQKKQLEYWRKIRDGGVEAWELREENSLESSMARWFFKNRKLFYRRTSGSYADGREFYASIEDLTAQVLFSISVPNQGRFRESLEQTRERELAILRGEIEPPPEEEDAAPLPPELQKAFTQALEEAGHFDIE